MAQGELKVGEVIEVTYQATGTESGLDDVVMEIYDEGEVHDDEGDFPDVTMTEIGSTGRYKGSFTPDAEGKWRIMVDSVVKKGKMVRDFDVVGHNIDSVGDDMAKDATVAKDGTVSKEATAAKDATVAKAATVAKDATVAKAGADGDTLETLSDQLDSIASPDAPPMIG